MIRVHSLRWGVVVLTAALLVGIAHREARCADPAGDLFDGAIWRFSMTLKKGRRKTLKGVFRVSDDVLYQKQTPQDPDFSKQVGKNHPNGKKTRTEFNDLRAFAGDRKDAKQWTRVKGTARLVMDDLGEWSGVFTDENGADWEFKCSRVQE